MKQAYIFFIVLSIVAISIPEICTGRQHSYRTRSSRTSTFSTRPSRSMSTRTATRGTAFSTRRFSTTRGSSRSFRSNTMGSFAQRSPRKTRAGYYSRPDHISNTGRHHSSIHRNQRHRQHHPRMNGFGCNDCGFGGFGGGWGDGFGWGWGPYWGWGPGWYNGGFGYGDQSSNTYIIDDQRDRPRFDYSNDEDEFSDY